MADNAQPGGTGDTYRTKDRAGVETQIVGLDVAVGSGTEALMSAANPLPVYPPDNVASGTITATDAVLGTYVGDGTVKTGTPTAASYVAMALHGGESAYVVRLSGTFGSGTIWVEVSPDSTNGIDGGWTTAMTRQSGINNTVLDESLTGAGIYRGNAANMTYVRFRVTGATTPSIAVAARAGSGTGAVFLNASIPAGSNAVGYVKQSGAANIATAQVTPTTTAGTLVAARALRNRLVIRNLGNVDIWVGPATVTTANGFKVDVGGSLVVSTVALLQAIIATGTMTGAVHVLEEYET